MLMDVVVGRVKWRSAREREGEGVDTKEQRTLFFLFFQLLTRNIGLFLLVCFDGLVLHLFFSPWAPLGMSVHIHLSLFF